MDLIVHIDGGARGNPGPAGAGVIIQDESGSLVHEAGYFLGRQTNNAAEYHALLRGLQRTAACAPDRVTIYSDSELLVRQITGEYRVKSPLLAKLFEQAQLLLVQIGRWSIRHVRREQNRRADELANMAMDQERDVIVLDTEKTTPGPATESAPREASTPTSTTPAPTSGTSNDQPPQASNEHRCAYVTVARQAKPDGCPAGGV